VLNRIRRALSLTRVRVSSRGRHRRPLTPSRPPGAHALPASADAATVDLGHASDSANHRHLLRGEDTALVRPYVLAWEKRVRPCPVVVAPHLSTDAWSALAGVR
jgi:hypothetical protein